MMSHGYLVSGVVISIANLLSALEGIFLVWELKYIHHSKLIISSSAKLAKEEIRLL